MVLAFGEFEVAGNVYPMVFASMIDGVWHRVSHERVRDTVGEADVLTYPLDGVVCCWAEINR